MSRHPSPDRVDNQGIFFCYQRELRLVGPPRLDASPVAFPACSRATGRAWGFTVDSLDRLE